MIFFMEMVIFAREDSVSVVQLKRDGTNWVKLL